MRREELTSIGMAQKAHTLCEQIRRGEPFHLNSDGTTKNQHKINGVAINGLVLSINEVPDGSAETIMEDIGNELAVLNRWNVPVEWNGGMEWWNGMVEWNGGMEWWNGMVEWNGEIV